MALPQIRKKLNGMLASKKSLELAGAGTTLESMALEGNEMAKTVIGMHNDMQLINIESMQRKMKIYDGEKFQNLRNNVERKNENKFFSMNLQ